MFIGNGNHFHFKFNINRLKNVHKKQLKSLVKGNYFFFGSNHFTVDTG